MSLRILLARRVVAGQRTDDSAMTQLLAARGHAVRERPDGPLDADEAEVDLVWVHGNAAWYPQLCDDLVARDPRRRPPVVLWHFEPLPPPRASGLPRPRLHLREVAKVLLRDPRATDPYTNARRLAALRRHGLPDVLAVTTRARQEFLAERGVDALWAPYGGHPLLGRDLALPREIPVLFLGTLDVPRRRRLLNRLRRSGVDVRCQSDWGDPGGYGEHRTVLLNRTRILLNVLRQPSEFPGLRFVLGMCNGALVLSEPVYRPEPLVPGRHFVCATIAEMPDAIRRLLAREDERARVAEAGRELVTNELTLERSLQWILERVAARCGVTV